MFDLVIEELDQAQTADAFDFCSRTGLQVGCQELLLAAHWADLHPAEGLLPATAGAGTLIGERAAQLGGDGTPTVAEFAPAELAPRFKLSIGQTRSLIADALDLRHRFGRIWHLVRRGIVHDKTVRLVARSCRDLTAQQAAEVDRMLARHLIGIGRRRLERLLDAAILRVDADHMAKLAEEAKRARFVRLGQATEHGTKTVYTRMGAPAAIRLDAMINRLADIISTTDQPIVGVPHPEPGQDWTRDVWRSVAHELLGNTLLAASILIRHEQPDLFDVLAELQQPPLAFDPASDNVQPDHYPANDPGPIPFDPDCEPPLDEETLPTDPEDPRGCSPGQMSDDPAAPDLDKESFAGDDHDQDFADADRERRRSDPADVDQQRGSTGNLDPFLREHCQEQAVRLLLRRLDVRKLLPSAMLYAHHYPGDHHSPIARIEDLGPASMEQLGQWLADYQVRIQPVIDLNDIPAADAYEIPDRIRTAMHLRNPASIFPYSNTVSGRMDQDHTIPFRRRPDGTPAQPGQTGVHNLGPENRPEHRFVTHGRISVRQPVPDSYVWRTHLGQVLITSAAGTFDLGTSDFARAVWHAARDSATFTLIA